MIKLVSLFLSAVAVDIGHLYEWSCGRASRHTKGLSDDLNGSDDPTIDNYNHNDMLWHLVLAYLPRSGAPPSFNIEFLNLFRSDAHCIQLRYGAIRVPFSGSGLRFFFFSPLRILATGQFYTSSCGPNIASQILKKKKKEKLKKGSHSRRCGAHFENRTPRGWHRTIVMLRPIIAFLLSLFHSQEDPVNKPGALSELGSGQV